MQHLPSVFKLTIAGLMVYAASACKDIPRDNILDPKNPNSYRALVISLEAFVNTENDQQYNENMLSALKSLYSKYDDKVVFMQYHRNTTQFSDNLAIPENEILYEQYLNIFDDDKGVPDVFINGTRSRIQGASSVATAFERIENAIQPFLIENTFLTIEPMIQRTNSTLTISTKIARLGSKSISDLIVRSIVAERLDSDVHTRVVRHLENSNLIPLLEPGEQKEITFSDYTITSENDLYVVITVTSNDNLRVHQSIEVPVR
jgi:hypothetical protein